MSRETGDSGDRQRFTEEIDSNFSVQASAGAGKTTLLIARVRHLTQTRPEELQRLVLVTYTNRAANEIRQRLRSQLLDDYPQGIPPVILQGMSRMFIGTIHRFCLQIIQDYALFSGFPSKIEVHSRIRPEWIEKWEPELLSPPSHQRRWISDLHRYELAWEASEKNRQVKTTESLPLPTLELDPEALDQVTGRSSETIAYYQKTWKAFCHLIAENRPAEIPEYDGKGGKSLQEAWPQVLAPLLQKIDQETFQEIDLTSARIQQKRFQEGTLLFSDQIALAFALLHRPSIRTALQHRNYRILLDEAQDTDPFQFLILLELTRPPGSPAFQWNSFETPPRPGLFSMVGDLKQSIYRDRADLQIYQEIHSKLSQLPAGEPLLLSKTFRCRPQIVAWVNQQFSAAFQSQPDQVEYHPLNNEHPTQKGQVLLWKPPTTSSKLSSSELFKQEAYWILSQIKQSDLSLLRASSWSEVALLAPTRKMLTALQQACITLQIPYKTHFDTPQHERIEYRWLIALLSLQEKPDDSFNLLGILREIFAFSDSDLATIQHSLSHPLTLFTENSGVPAIDSLLSNMRSVQKECRALSLSRVARRWIEAFQIRGRLLAATLNCENPLRGLDTLLLKLTQNDPRPRSEQLQQWLEDLHITAPDPSLENPHAIQLMTIKKSKGLQWDCVILPFLGAISGEGKSTRSHPSIEWFTPPYDRPVLNLNKGNQSPHAKEEEEKQKQKFALERQRLYYVACTRSRQTLILVDDADHWTKILASGEPKLASPNAYESLTADRAEKYPGGALKIAASLTNPTLTSDPALLETVNSAPLPQFSQWNFKPAQPIHSRTKITPSALKSPPSTTTLTPSTSSKGREYGSLWHSILEFFPWKKSAEIQFTYLSRAQECITDSELKTRFHQEWELFSRSSLFPLLNNPRSFVYSEIPYTVLQETTVEEGQIDLILQTQEQTQLIDWKTDSLSSEAFEKNALPGYTLQLQSYLRVLQENNLPQATAEIYHTPTGKVWRINTA